MKKIKKRIIGIYAMMLTAVPALFAGPLEGKWTGMLKINPQFTLRLQLNVSADGEVTFDSPDQSAFGIPCQVSYLSADSINLSVDKIGMRYAGHLEGDSIIGTFLQGTLKLPLTFSSTDEEASKPKRPQTPVPPFPYTTEEVRVSNPEATGVTLAGTLTLPENYSAGTTPVVVLVSGSGFQDRDEELFGHKPFAVIADRLAREGVATLRYDDRGAFESTGDASTATTADFASDARALISWLRQSGRFGNIGLLGHSEGGEIGYMLGSEEGTDSLDFVISLAGPSVKGTKIVAYQNQYTLGNNGIGEKESTDFASALEKSIDYLLAHTDISSIPEEKVAEFYPQKNESGTTMMLSASVGKAASDLVGNPWMRYFLAYDPQGDIRRIKVPALLIYGSKDRQVPGEMNLAAAGGLNDKVRCILVDVNHLMQECETGSPAEYGQIDQTISEQVLDSIVSFIRSVTDGI